MTDRNPNRWYTLPGLVLFAVLSWVLFAVAAGGMLYSAIYYPATFFGITTVVMALLWWDACLEARAQRRRTRDAEERAYCAELDLRFCTEQMADLMRKLPEPTEATP